MLVYFPPTRKSAKEGTQVEQSSIDVCCLFRENVCILPHVVVVVVGKGGKRR